MIADKKIIRIDASALKDAACIRRLFLNIVLGYRTKKLSNDLLYGSAFHYCVEVYDRTQDTNQALAAAIGLFNSEIDNYVIKDSAKFLDVGHLTNTCLKYFREVKTNSIFTSIEPLLKNVTLTEEKVSIPFYADAKVIVLLEGTIDGIVKIINGCPAIKDWKTTRAHDRRDFFDAFSMSVQLRTYLWMLQWIIKNKPDCELSRKLTEFPKIGCFIYAAFLTPSGAEFERSRVFMFGNEEMTEYESLLLEEVECLVGAYLCYDTTGALPLAQGMINGTCKTYNTQCKYFNACSSCVNTQEGEDKGELLKRTLDNHFIKVPYLPLTFGGNKNK